MVGESEDVDMVRSLLYHSEEPSGLCVYMYFAVKEEEVWVYLFIPV